MKKIKSYTLLELIVVMAISGVVLLNIIGLYLYVQKQYVIFKENNKDRIELAQFVSALSNDLNYACEIEVINNNIYIVKNNGKKLSYQDSNNLIIRDDVKKDTFQLAINKINTYLHEQVDLINQIELEIKTGDRVKTLTFFKEYDNAVIINHQIKLNENGN